MQEKGTDYPEACSMAGDQPAFLALPGAESLLRGTYCFVYTLADT